MENSKQKEETILDIREIKQFIELDCDYGLEISINGQPKIEVAKEWLKSNIDLKLKNVVNIRYIHENINEIEIKYKNGDTIELSAID